MPSRVGKSRCVERGVFGGGKACTLIIPVPDAIQVWDALAHCTATMLQEPTPLMQAAMAWLQSGMTAKSWTPKPSARGPKRSPRIARARLDIGGRASVPHSRMKTEESSAWRRPGRSSRTRRGWQLVRSAPSSSQPAVAKRTSDGGSRPVQEATPAKNLHPSQERAFARRIRYLRNRVFYGNTEPDLLQGIMRGRERRKGPPSVVWSSSRKHHNKQMHAINGNTAPVVQMDDTRGSGRVLTCHLWGMVAESSPLDESFLELVASALDSRVSPANTGDWPVTMRVAGSRELMRVFVRPRALNGPQMPAVLPGVATVAVLDVCASADSIYAAMDVLTHAARESDMPCAVVLTNLAGGIPMVDIATAVCTLLMDLRAAVRVLFCANSPPDWATIRAGIQQGPVLAPWIDRQRNGVLDRTLSPPRWITTPDMDAPGHLCTSAGGPPGYADSVIVPPPMVFLSENQEWCLIEIVGLPLFRGVWFAHSTARVQHLLECMDSVYGDSGFWRLSFGGHPLRPEALLVSLCGGVVRAAQRVRSGAPKKREDSRMEVDDPAAGDRGSGSEVVRGASDGPPPGHAALVPPVRQHDFDDGEASARFPSPSPVDTRRVETAGEEDLFGEDRGVDRASVVGEDFAEVSEGRGGMATPRGGMETPRYSVPTPRASPSHATGAEEEHRRSLEEWSDGRADAGRRLPPAPGALATQASEAVLEADLVDTLAVGEADLEVGVISERYSARRRAMPGAATSAQDFRRLLDIATTDARENLRGVQKQVPTSTGSIIQTRRKLHQQVGARYPSWPATFTRIGVAALAVYRMRLEDLWTRETALLIWVLEGETHLRVHNGVAFFYDEAGSYQVFKGVAPEGTLGRVKEILLWLEGFFRSMAPETKPEDDAILDALNAILERGASAEVVLEQFMKRSLFQGPPRWRRRRFPGAENDPPAEEADGGGKWTMVTAQSVSKLGLQLQKGLLEEKLVSYLIEWCETPDIRRPGVCYSDSCILYEVEGTTDIIKHVEMSTDNSIYLRIPHPLLDPVLEATEQRLVRFISQTFWCNVDVYECMLAAQALAKRGENIDRIFIGVSPGGTGQSLYSHFLASMYGPLHYYFDPTVWFRDEELRRQVEQYTGAIILTGQEAPETDMRLREDLYKKFMSADGIAGRKPYGITTRMLNLVAWKRLETNRPLMFHGVNDTNFPSILRRSFVWIPKGRFLDASILASRYPHHEADGVFPKDPDLKVFLSSGPCIAAGLHLQHGFEAKNDRLRCRTLIEQYAALGGDGGLTEDTMRKACGLKPRTRRVGAAVPAVAVPLSATPPEPQGDGEVDQLQRICTLMTEKILESGRTYTTLGKFKLLSLPTGFPRGARELLWRRLQEEDYTVSVHLEGIKIQEGMRPRIRCEVSLVDLVGGGPLATRRSSREQLHVHRLSRFLSSHHALSLNVSVLEDYYGSILESLKPTTKGRTTNALKDRLADTQHELANLVDTYKTAHRLLADVETLTETQRGSASSPKRRRLDKGPADFTGPVSIDVMYTGILGDLFRARLQARSPASQGCPRRILTHLIPDTVDLDIENAMFILLHQLVVRLKAAIPASCVETLRRCAEERDRIITDVLRMNRPEGKRLLNKVINGGAVPPELRDAPFMRELQTLSSVLQWLAIDALPEVYDRCRAERKEHPERSVLFFFWSAAEDCVLQAWVDHVDQFSFPHVSLHYDGLRVSSPLPKPVDEFCRDCERAVLEATGFRVHIRPKEHLTFVQAIAKATCSRTVEEIQDPVLLQEGNCIPLALSRLLPATDECLGKLRDAENPDTRAAAERKSRSMRQVQDDWKVCLVPHVGLHVGDAPGALVISEHLGTPHCIGVRRVPNEPGLVDVWDGRDRSRIAIHSLDTLAADATDRRTIVSFFLYTTGDVLPADRGAGRGAHDRLLDLQAGASAADRREDDGVAGCLRVLPEWLDSDPEEDANVLEEASGGAAASLDDTTVRVGTEVC